MSYFIIKSKKKKHFIAKLYIKYYKKKLIAEDKL